MTYIWIAIGVGFLIGFINDVYIKGRNDESSASNLNINWGWKRKPFDPDTHTPSSLHGENYDEDE